MASEYLSEFSSLSGCDFQILQIEMGGTIKQRGKIL